MAIQSDGKIVVAGTSTETVNGSPYVTLARYDSDGDLDDDFKGPDGTGAGLFKITSKTTYYANSVAVFSDKIYAAGYCGLSYPDIAVMRFWQ